MIPGIRPDHIKCLVGVVTKRMPALVCATCLIYAAPLPADAQSQRADHGGGTAETPAVQVWGVLAGTSLRSSLDVWAREAGWKLIWDGEMDYRMMNSVVFRGPFEIAASSLIDALNQSDPELSADFHQGDRVLHVRKTE